jgi:hypothetical protein
MIKGGKVQTTRSYKAMWIGLVMVIVGIIYHVIHAMIYKTSFSTVNILSIIVMVIGFILCSLPLIFGIYKNPKEEEKKSANIIKVDYKSSKMELVYEEYDFSLPKLSGYVNVVKGLSKNLIPGLGSKHFNCYVSPKFKELGLNRRGKATGPTKFDVYYVYCNNDFLELLKKFTEDLDERVMTQHQVSDFFITYTRNYYKYPLEIHPTRYLVKKGDSYFLIDIFYTTGMFSHRIHLKPIPLKNLEEERQPYEFYFIVPKVPKKK